MLARTYPVSGPLDLRRTLGPLSRGPGDPTIHLASGRAWWATRTRDGAASLALAHVGDELRVEAWGPGAGRALADVPVMLALAVAPAAIPAGHPLVTDLARRAPGVRIRARAPSSNRWSRRSSSRRSPARRHGGRGSVSCASTARRPPAHPNGGSGSVRHRPPSPRSPTTPITRSVLSSAGPTSSGGSTARAAWFEAIVDLPLAEAYARLTAVPGIGPWTAAEVGVRALGDQDAVSVGDFHLPNLVAYALAREPRGTDDRMLELLEPYRGARARVVRLLELSGLRAPRYGPRLSVQRIEDR